MLQVFTLLLHYFLAKGNILSYTIVTFGYRHSRHFGQLKDMTDATEAMPQGSANMSVTLQAETKWATPHDWAHHKATIIKLYSDDDMTLKEGMQTMQDRHGFFAT